MRIVEICKDNLRISPSSGPDASPGMRQDRGGFFAEGMLYLIQRRSFYRSIQTGEGIL